MVCVFADVCPHCGIRPGLIFGLRGLGVEERRHAGICRRQRGRAASRAAAAAGSPSSHVPVTTLAEAANGIANGGFSVVVTDLSGDEKVLTGVSGSSCLQDFRQKVAVEFETGPALVQLVLGTRFLNTSDSRKTLVSLGFGEGSHVTFIKQRFLAVVESTRVEVCFAGTPAVNGTYVCCADKASHGSGSLAFRQEGTPVPHWIAWWPASPGAWPAGWYIEANDYYGIYYHPCQDNTKLPPDLWEIYTKFYSRPGCHPVPGIQTA